MYLLICMCTAYMWVPVEAIKGHPLKLELYIGGCEPSGVDSGNQTQSEHRKHGLALLPHSFCLAKNC